MSRETQKQNDGYMEDKRMAMKENVEALAVKTALGYIHKDPEKNFPKLLGCGIRKPHEPDIRRNG